METTIFLDFEEGDGVCIKEDDFDGDDDDDDDGDDDDGDDVFFLDKDGELIISDIFEILNFEKNERKMSLLLYR